MTAQLLALLLAHQVDWLAPEGCPDRAAVDRLLAEHQRPGKTSTASVRVDEPRTADQRWRAVVMTPSARIRVVEARDCERVTRAAVLVVTLAATELEAEVEAAPPSEPAEPVEAAAPVEKIEHQRLSFRLEPLVSTNVGVLPVVGFSLGAAVSLLRGPYLGQVSLTQWFQRESRAGLQGGRFDVVSASLQGCRLWSPVEALELGPCVGVEAGILTGVGTGVTNPHLQRVFWAAGLAAGMARYQVSPSVRPWAALAAGANLTRPAFVVSTGGGQVDVHRMGVAVGRLTIGVELSFQ